MGRSRFKRVGFSIIVLFTLPFIFMVYYNNQIYSEEFKGLNEDHIKDYQDGGLGKDDEPKLSSSKPNGKPLIINQYANISNSITYSDISSGENVSFTLTQGWTSKNTTINYEGVSQKKDIITNGGFDSDESGWVYKTNDNTHYEKLSYSSTEGNPGGRAAFTVTNDAKDAGDYGYYEQNITLPEELCSLDAYFSFDYYYSWFPRPTNCSLFMSIIIGNVERNKTLNLKDIPDHATWYSMDLYYNPVSYGQVLPGNITIRLGVYTNEASTMSSASDLRLDNIKYELWTKPNKTGIIKAYDNEFPQNYTYYNTSIGKGYSFIDIERTRSPTGEVDFTIHSNISDLLDFSIETITITSYAVKEFNSTISSKLGSLYTPAENIIWQVEFSISSIPGDYDCWVEFDKPSDWSFIHIIDGFEADRTGDCLGTSFGSNRLIIPNSILGPGLWKLEAISKNYISIGNLEVWNSTTFVTTSQLTLGDIIQVNITLNDSISLPNTQINCSIYYPNASIFWHDSKEPTSYNEKFGNITVGKNMTVGDYIVKIIWVNNQSSLNIDKVGFIELDFFIWHHTNLTAVNSYFEQIAGDPLLLKVNYSDYDINDDIDFATVTYNSTFGPSGTMAYQGLGLYFVDLDTSPLGLGDYYFSFNASKTYFENQTKKDLIHLKIIAQPLAMVVPTTAINAMGNSYAVCRINVTGAISGALVWPANVSTDWQNWYNITAHGNGTYTLNFSTQDLPPEGILKSYTVTIYANKTNYGSTSNFITIIINPIPAEANTNITLYNGYINEIIDIKVNYTLKSSSVLIDGANCSVTWDSSFSVTHSAESFIVRLFTTGLTPDVYNALIKLNKSGHENVFAIVSIIISEQDVNISVSIDSQEIQEHFLQPVKFNEVITISCQAYAEAEKKYLTGANVTFINIEYKKNLIEIGDWYNNSITITIDDFSIGINYVYILFLLSNYTPTIFSFEIQVNQININMDPIDSIETHPGETIKIKIKLTEEGSKKPITGASVTYKWDFGVGESKEKDDGIYELNLEIPENLEGNYKIELIISKEGAIYKITEEEFILIVKPREIPKYWTWIIIAILLGSVGILTILSLRAYVFLPRARKKESELLAKTQRFKDMRNIQAIMLIHKKSGLPLYHKPYTFLENIDKTLFSGFIQAILTLGMKIAEKESDDFRERKVAKKYGKDLIEIDFKYFFTLVSDQDDLRIIFILKEKSSERLKKQINLLSTAISTQFADQLEKFDGKLGFFHQKLPLLINNLIALHYKELFKLNEDEAYFLKTKKSGELSSMEVRIINVLKSYLKLKKDFYLENILEWVIDKNKNKIIEAIESLIQRKLIINSKF